MTRTGEIKRKEEKEETREGNRQLYKNAFLRHRHQVDKR